MTHRRMRGLAVAVALTLTAAAPVPLASAEPTTPTPSPGVTSAEPTPAASPTPVSSPAPTPPPTPTPTPEKTRSTAAGSTASDPVNLTLAVRSAGGPVAGAFYQDLGSFAIAGQAAGLADGATVSITRKTATTAAVVVAQAKVADGAYAVSLPVTDPGAYTFQASTVISGDPDVIFTSPAAVITVADAGTTIDQPVAKLDALLNPTITGSVFPARAGVKINIDVMKGSKPKTVAQATTDGAGRYRLIMRYDHAHLGKYTIRSAYPAANTARWEKSSTVAFARIAVLNAVVTETTAAEVAKTYRKGCPVGRSKLRTITMNFYGRDKQMHSGGVIIIRTDLAAELIKGFGKALDHRYPVGKMNNPNLYGGNDPKQMKANNTSGFNCRKVVGNPYAQSPHSYGIALDVNTVQNPYRDRHGKWWPTNGKSYVKRSNKRPGMLYKGSYLTKSLRGDHFFWGGLWNPGRDYQHFEYRK